MGNFSFVSKTIALQKFKSDSCRLLCHCMGEGGAKLSSVWIYDMCCCDCRTSTQVRAPRNFAVLRGVINPSLFYNIDGIKMKLERGNLDDVIVTFFFFQGKGQLHESPYVHGSSCSRLPSSCRTPDGGKCGEHHTSTCKRRPQDPMVSDLQFCVGVFSKFDQLFGH